MKIYGVCNLTCPHLQPQHSIFSYIEKLSFKTQLNLQYNILIVTSLVCERICYRATNESNTIKQTDGGLMKSSLGIVAQSNERKKKRKTI